jgi:hypothetical protein
MQGVNFTETVIASSKLNIWPSIRQQVAYCENKLNIVTV